MARSTYSTGAKMEWGVCQDEVPRFYITGSIFSSTGRDNFFNTNKLWTMMTTIERMEQYMMKGLIVGVASLMDGVREDAMNNVVELLAEKADREAAELLGEDSSVFASARGKKPQHGKGGNRKGGKRKGGKRHTGNNNNNSNKVVAKAYDHDDNSQRRSINITKEMADKALGIVSIFMQKEPSTIAAVKLLRDGTDKLSSGHTSLMIMLSLVTGYLETINRDRECTDDAVVGACVSGIEMVFEALFNKPVHGRIYLSMVMGLFGIRSFAKRNGMSIEEAKPAYRRHCFDISARSMQKNYVFFITAMAYMLVWDIADDDGKVSKIDLAVYRRTMFSIEHLFEESIRASPVDKIGLLTVFASILEHSHMYSGAVTIFSSLIMMDVCGSPNVGWCHYRMGKCYVGMDKEWGMHNMCARVMHQEDAYIMPKPSEKAIRWRALMSFIQAMNMSSTSSVRTMAYLAIVDLIGISRSNITAARSITCFNIGRGVENRVQRIRDAIAESDVKVCTSCACVDESKLTVQWDDETKVYCSTFCLEMDPDAGVSL